MVISSNKKRIINIVLSALIVAILLSGIGIGVFFILKDKTKLSARQKQFGAVVNMSNQSLVQSEVSTTLLSSLQSGDEVLVVDVNYSLVKNGSDYRIVKNSNGETVRINSLVQFDKIEMICGNLAIVSLNGTNKLINLLTGDLVLSLENAEWFVVNDYLMIKATKGYYLKYYPNNQVEINYIFLTFNTISTNAVLEINTLSDLIDVRVGDNYLVLTTVSETRIYSLTDFELVKSFVNVGEFNLDASNIVSSVTDNKYLMSEYVNAFELSKNVVLIETTKNVSTEEASVISKLSNGENKGYNVSYQIYDAKSNEFFDLDNNNKVFRWVQAGLSDDYYAILSLKIKNDKTIDESDIEITYYQLEDDKKGNRKIHKIVSYDYDEKGLIVGFDGTNLLTTGGSGSNIVSFNGKEKSVKIDEFSVLSATNSKNILIETTAIGQKRILDLNGNKFVDGSFLDVSPIVDGVMIAIEAQKVFRINTNKEKVEISNFSEEFASVVMLGIGLYFTDNNENYNVYNVKGELLFENVKVDVSYNYLTKEVLVKIDGSQSKLLKITPIDKAGVITDGTINNGVYVFGSENQIKTVSESSNSLLISENKAEPTKVQVDSEYGYGISSFELDFELKNIKNNFKAYASLSNLEKSMIPTFDNSQELSYETNQTKFVFDGAYFVSGDNFILAIIRLDNNQSKSYMLNLALKDVYLKSLKATYNKGQVAKMVLTEEADVVSANVDASKRLLPAISLKGSGLTILDNVSVQTRNVDYNAFGYDGGVVISLDSASKISLDFELSNIYVSSNFDSGYISYSNAQEIVNNGKYTAQVVNENGYKYLEVKAIDGYLIAGFNLQMAKSNASVYNAQDVVYELSKISSIGSYFKIDISNYDANMFRLYNIKVVERYAQVSFVDYNQNVIDKVYYFNGYGSDLTTNHNPAFLGFENFKRKTKIAVPEYRVGYVFNGFSVDGNIIVNKTGNFVGNIELFNMDYSVNGIEYVKAEANYTAKEFNVYFVNGNESLSGEERVVKFDSALTDMPELSKIGYDFLGWYSQDDVKYQEGSIYNVDNHLTLTAKWKAEVYDLTFDANFAGYKNSTVNGYDYNIKNAQFTRNFKEFYTGALFNRVTKQITYDELYGELPYIMGYGSSEDIYLFLGWFENADVNDKGNEYTSSNKVTIDSARTLYAHYTKEIYSVKLKIEGDFKDKFREIRCEGATSEGVSSSFSTISGNAEQLLVMVDNEVILYTLQSKTINIGVDLLPGYHFTEMSIDFAGGKYYYDESSLAPTPSGGFGFTDNEAASGNISVTATNDAGYSLNVGLMMTEAYASSASGHDAEIMVVAEATEVEFKMSKNRGEVKIQNSDSEEVDDINFNTVRKDDINNTSYYAFSYIVDENNSGYQTSFLQKLTITSGASTKTLSFNLVYNGAMLKLEHSGSWTNNGAYKGGESESSVEHYSKTSGWWYYNEHGDNQENHEFMYMADFGNGSNTTNVYVSISTDGNKYSYQVRFYAIENVSVSAEFYQPTGKKVYADISSVGANCDILGNSQGFSWDTPTTLTIKEKPDTYISQVSITYGGYNLSIFKQSVNVNFTSDTFRESCINCDGFENLTADNSLSGAGISFSYNKTTKAFTVTASSLIDDLHVNIVGVMFRAIKVSGSQYTLSGASHVFNEVNGSIGFITEAKNYKIVEIPEGAGQAIQTMYICFGQDNTSTLTIAPYDNYVLSYSDLHSYSMAMEEETNEDTGKISYMIGQNIYEVFITVSPLARTLTLNRLNQRFNNKKESSFVPDNVDDGYVGSSLTYGEYEASFEGYYYNSENKKEDITQISFDGFNDLTNKKIYLTGDNSNIIKITVASYATVGSEKGYMLDMRRTGLYIVGTNNPIIDSECFTTSGLLSPKTTFTYDLKQKYPSADLEFCVYYIAKQYNIELAARLIKNDAYHITNEEGGFTGDSQSYTCYFNGPKLVLKLEDNPFTKTGYHFVGYDDNNDKSDGYSEINKNYIAGDNLTYAEYSNLEVWSGDPLTDYSSGTPKVGNETIYCIFMADYYVVHFEVTHPSLSAGSSDVTFGEVPEGEYRAVYDANGFLFDFSNNSKNLPKLTNDYFDFVGWFTRDPNYKETTSDPNGEINWAGSYMIEDSIILYSKKQDVKQVSRGYADESSAGINLFENIFSHSANIGFSRNADGSVKEGEIKLYSLWIPKTYELKYKWINGVQDTISKPEHYNKSGTIEIRFDEVITGLVNPETLETPNYRQGFSFTGFHTEINKAGDLVENNILLDKILFDKMDKSANFSTDSTIYLYAGYDARTYTFWLELDQDLFDGLVTYTSSYHDGETVIWLDTNGDGSVDLEMTEPNMMRFEVTYLSSFSKMPQITLINGYKFEGYKFAGTSISKASQFTSSLFEDVDSTRDYVLKGTEYSNAQDYVSGETNLVVEVIVGDQFKANLQIGSVETTDIGLLINDDWKSPADSITGIEVYRKVGDFGVVENHTGSSLNSGFGTSVDNSSDGSISDSGTKVSIGQDIIYKFTIKDDAGYVRSFIIKTTHSDGSSATYLLNIGWYPGLFDGYTQYQGFYYIDANGDGSFNYVRADDTKAEPTIYSANKENPIPTDCFVDKNNDNSIDEGELPGINLGASESILPDNFTDWIEIAGTETYSFNGAYFKKEEVGDIRETRFPNVRWFVKKVDGHLDVTDTDGATLQYLEPFYDGYQSSQQSADATSGDGTGSFEHYYDPTMQNAYGDNDGDGYADYLIGYTEDNAVKNVIYDSKGFLQIAYKPIWGAKYQEVDESFNLALTSGAIDFMDGGDDGDDDIMPLSENNSHPYIFTYGSYANSDYKGTGINSDPLYYDMTKDVYFDVHSITNIGNLPRYKTADNIVICVSNGGYRNFRHVGANKVYRNTTPFGAGYAVVPIISGGNTSTSTGGNASYTINESDLEDFIDNIEGRSYNPYYKYYKNGSNTIYVYQGSSTRPNFKVDGALRVYNTDSGAHTLYQPFTVNNSEVGTFTYSQKNYIITIKSSLSNAKYKNGSQYIDETKFKTYRASNGSGTLIYVNGSNKNFAYLEFGSTGDYFSVYKYGTTNVYVDSSYNFKATINNSNTYRQYGIYDDDQLNNVSLYKKADGSGSNFALTGTTKIYKYNTYYYVYVPASGEIYARYENEAIKRYRYKSSSGAVVYVPMGGNTHNYILSGTTKVYGNDVYDPEGTRNRYRDRGNYKEYGNCCIIDGYSGLLCSKSLTCGTDYTCYVADETETNPDTGEVTVTKEGHSVDITRLYYSNGWKYNCSVCGEKNGNSLPKISDVSSTTDYANTYDYADTSTELYNYVSESDCSSFGTLSSYADADDLNDYQTNVNNYAYQNGDGSFSSSSAVSKVENYVSTLNNYDAETNYTTYVDSDDIKCYNCKGDCDGGCAVEEDWATWGTSATDTYSTLIKRKFLGWKSVTPEYGYLTYDPNSTQAPEGSNGYVDGDGTPFPDSVKDRINANAPTSTAYFKFKIELKDGVTAPTNGPSSPTQFIQLKQSKLVVNNDENERDYEYQSSVNNSERAAKEPEAATNQRYIDSTSNPYLGYVTELSFRIREVVVGYEVNWFVGIDYVKAKTETSEISPELDTAQQTKMVTYVCDGVSNTILVDYNTKLGSDADYKNALDPVYMKGRTFKHWSLNGGSAVGSTLKITENVKLVACSCSSSAGSACGSQETQKAQQVTFYFWTPTGYQAFDHTLVMFDGTNIVADNIHYVSNFDSTNSKNCIGTSNARVSRMPSPANELWPVGKFFAGYAIGSNNPNSESMKTSFVNSNDRKAQGTLFDNTDMVDSELHVYAVYKKYEFKIVGIDKVTISFGDVLPNGTVYNFDTTEKISENKDVDVIYLKTKQVELFLGKVNGGMSKEAALNEVSWSKTVANLVDTKVMAVIFKNPDGSYGYKGLGSYIFAVAEGFAN